MTPKNFIAFARCINTPMLLIDREGNILSANKAAGSHLRISPDKLSEMNLRTLVSNSAEEVLSFLKTCTRSRDLSPGSLSINADHNESIPYLFEGYLVDPKTEHLPAILVLRFRPREYAHPSFTVLNQKINVLTKEVARRKRLELERLALLKSEKAARMLAEQASRSKDEFLAIVSHELRAPLNVFKGWTDLLISGEVSTSELADVYKILERNCDHQIRLIEDLLDTSRIITGKLKLDSNPVPIASVVEQTVESIRPAAESKNIDLFVSASHAVGSVWGDADRLRQVIWNLLTNAVKFSPKGTSIHVSVRRVNSKVEIKVKDQGEGIDADFLPFVFERFYQEDGSKSRPHGGLGLGLGITRHIVELHGGEVAAESPGKEKGSTFTVALPLAAIDIGSKLSNGDDFKIGPLQNDIEINKDSASQDLAFMRILVVDDEADARFLISRILQRHGAEVVTSHSAKDAFRKITISRFDLIVSDIGMPGESGYELIKKIRQLDTKLGGETPAAALTGFVSGGDRTTALEAGFHEHLSKPVSANKLLKVVKSLSRKHNK